MGSGPTGKIYYFWSMTMIGPTFEDWRFLQSNCIVIQHGHAEMQYFFTAFRCWLKVCKRQTLNKIYFCHYQARSPSQRWGWPCNACLPLHPLQSASLNCSQRGCAGCGCQQISTGNYKSWYALMPHLQRPALFALHFYCQ